MSAWGVAKVPKSHCRITDSQSDFRRGAFLTWTANVRFHSEFEKLHRILTPSLSITPTISSEMTPVVHTSTKSSTKPRLNSFDIIDLEHNHGAHK